jgi:release factor glutamine methyltransferase
MGTGSGVIALCASRCGARVTAVDINPQAVRCASDNAAAAGSDIDCRESDLFSALSSERFDVIAWNPPFFPKTAANVAEAALYAGKDYSVISRFASEAREHLNAHGRVLLILSMDVDVNRVESLFTTAGLSHERVFSCKWGLGETMVIIEFR